jgi:predicted DNA-binding protein with PD1-like motif
LKATEGRIGRIFIIRLEDGDVIPACLEAFAKENEIAAGLVTMIGGIGSGEIVTGPYSSHERPPIPMTLPVDGVHEVVGSGVIVQDINGDPVLHIHASLGRAGKSSTGCLRPGVKTWLVGEVVLQEIIGVTSKRLLDKASGFALLEPDAV